MKDRADDSDMATFRINKAMLQPSDAVRLVKEIDEELDTDGLLNTIFRFLPMVRLSLPDDSDEVVVERLAEENEQGIAETLLAAGELF